MNSKPLLLAVILCLAAHPLGAIELSLEENRAERGNIGYIDMQRLFKAYPETIKAKENFEELVRQTEEQVNLRKADILHLRNELSSLKIEREYLAKNAVIASSAAAPSPGVAVSTAALAPAKEAARPAAPAASAPTPGDLERACRGATLRAAAEQTAEAYDEKKRACQKAEDAKKKSEPLTINIPGVSTAPIVLAAPAASTAAAVAPSTAPTTASVSKSTAASAAVVSHSSAPAVSVVSQPSAVSAAAVAMQALGEMDSKIALKARELAQKEDDFKTYQASAEKNLLDLESRKTEILLGKIHRAVQEVAHKEGVSVVVDKGSILYGHDAVDLTEKVLKYLKGS